MTRHPEIFAALAAPFEPGVVKERAIQGRKLHYITATTAANRLDTVLGPENWDFEVAPWGDVALIGTITVRLPDGSTFRKSNVGGRAGMQAGDDDTKSAASDCLKRCAMLLGVGRYLYRDGVPSFYEGEVPTPGPRDHPRRPATGQDGNPPARRESWHDYITGTLREANRLWVLEMTRKGVPTDRRKEWAEISKEPIVVTHLVSRLIELGQVETDQVGKDENPTARDLGKSRRVIEDFFSRKPNSIKKAVVMYLEKKCSEARFKLGMPDPESEDRPTPPETVPGRGDAYEQPEPPSN